MLKTNEQVSIEEAIEAIELAYAQGEENAAMLVELVAEVEKSKEEGGQ
jgi:hypothetical protein